MNNNHCTPVCFPLPLAVLLVTIPPPRPLIGRERHACQCYTCDAQWAELTPVIMLGMQLQTIRYLCDVLLVLLCNCSCCCSMRKWGPTPGHQPPLYPKPTFLHITQNDLSQGVNKIVVFKSFSSCKLNTFTRQFEVILREVYFSLEILSWYQLHPISAYSWPSIGHTGHSQVPALFWFY